MKKISLDKIGARAARHVAAVITGAVVCTGMYIQGFRQNIYLVNHSATPLGHSALFERSGAKATITDYYTDKSKSVVAVTISLQENNTSPLPYNSTDYLVLLIDYQGNATSIPALFGRMGTDGDLFLIIPKPTNEVYHVVVANRNYLGSNLKISTDNKIIDVSNGSLAKIISEANTVGAGTNDIEETQNATNTKRDSIQFQFTLNPALDDERYRVEELDVETLLIQNDDGTTSFDFETFWTMTYKRNLINNAEKRLKETSKAISDLESRLSTFQKRYNENPEDASAKTNILDLQSQIETQEKIQSEQAASLLEYRNLIFDEKLFDDYLTKIFIYK